MQTSHIGRIVAGSVAAGFIAALVLIAGPFAGAQEHVISGVILLAFASGWASLAILSTRWTTQPQHWAALPAGFMAAAGAGLLAAAPSGAVIETLGWIWPPLFLALVGLTALRVHRTLHSRARIWVVYPMLFLYALCAIGGGYQTVRASLDRRTPVTGELIDVGGYRLRLSCAGTGTPTVVLESGLGETGEYWTPISTPVARDTRVCVYDRAGRGWSDPSPVPQDGIAVARDLHIVLERGRVPGPFVVVGHSSGAQYVRIFAGRYPEDVSGMVLLDGQPAEAFEGLPIFPLFYRVYFRVSALLPSVARLGAGRLSENTGVGRLPANARSMVAEFGELPTSLQEARSFQSLGDRPLVVVTAGRDPMAGWLPLQDQLATLSRNSSHRVVPYTHYGLLTDPAGAQVSIDAIRDVVHAVRFTVPLKKS